MEEYNPGWRDRHYMWKRETPSKIREVLNKNEDIIYKLGNTKFPKNAIRIMPGNDWEYVQIYVTNMRIISEGEKEFKKKGGVMDGVVSTTSDYTISWVRTPQIPVTINLENIVQFKYSAQTTKKSTKSLDFSFLRKPELLIKKRNGNSERFLIPKASPALAKKLNDFLTEFKEKLISEAQNRESALDYDVAIQLWEKAGKTKEATKVRKLKAEQRKVDQTVVHGDYVDDRDTIVKDSVINRSNVGAGGDDKLTKIKELKELLDSGAINEDDYEKMKREIIG